MRTNAVSIHKFEPDTVNEDAVLCDTARIAVSDGAGGGGVYADRWAAYLLRYLPMRPLLSAGELDKWIGEIWEPFYNACEAVAKKTGGLLLNKFYDEGSFATLAAVWRTSSDQCHWLTYGDSVVFHYNRRTQELEHSFTRLADFSRPPFLLNCKDELDHAGCRCGLMKIDKDSVILIASDTLAHYILTCYEILHPESFEEELAEAINGRTRHTAFILRTKDYVSGKRFYKDILKPLIQASRHKTAFAALMRSLEDRGLIGHDDYSLCWMYH